MAALLLAWCWSLAGAFAPPAPRKLGTRLRFTEVPDAPPTARFVSYEAGSAGSKPKLLVFGGVDGTDLVGVANRRRLSEWFDVRSLVLEPDDASTYGSLVRLVAAEAAGERVSILGESMGGVLALGFALERPEQVASLVVCNAATSYARAPVSLVAPLLPRIPEPVYESLSGFVTPLFGKSGWTDGISGSRDKGPESLLSSGRGLAAALPPATLGHREKFIVRDGARAVNARLSRLKGPPSWSERALFVASGADSVLPSVSECRRLSRICAGSAVRVEPGASHVLFTEANLLQIYHEADLLPAEGRRASPLDTTARSPIEVSMKAARLITSPKFFCTSPEGLVEEGLRHVPCDEGRPVLLVGNHQLFGLDGVLLVEEFLAEKRLGVVPLVYPPLLDDESPLAPLPYPLPGSAQMLRRFDALPAGAKEMCATLQAGKHCLVFPGGAREVFKRRGEQYALQWPDESALIRIAARYNATIVPFGGVGGDEFFGDDGSYVLDTSELLGQDNAVGAFLRSRTENLVSLVPDDSFVPPLVSPNGLPRRHYFLMGRAFDTTAVDAKSADACAALYAAVRAAVEQNVEYLLQRRDDDPFESTLRRLPYELATGGVQAPTFDADR